MGQRQVFERSLAGFIRLAVVIKNNGDHHHQAADMLFGHAAFAKCNSPGIAGEKMAVAFFDVGVAVAARGGHESDVAPKVVVGIVTAARVQGPNQKAAQLNVKRVFAGFEKLVVVDVFLAPVCRLLVQGSILGAERLVAGSIKDAIRMRVARRR